jgi:ribosome-associated protein
MQSRAEAARTSPSPTDPSPAAAAADTVLVGRILGWLDEAKAENIVSIDIRAKSSIGDTMIIASGRSDRHVGAIAEQLAEKLKTAGVSRVRIEGQKQCDWVLVDAGDIIVHVFRPEVREFYNLEKMWQADRPDDAVAH